MSFHKAPKKVCREIQRIQSNFLWGEKEGNRKVHWVGWERICQSMEKGGLGVKNIEVFNKALMLKWVWRILKGKDEFWMKVLGARYGNIRYTVETGSVLGGSKTNSAWWNNIIKFDQDSTTPVLVGNVFYKHGQGDSILFWESIWRGDVSLRESFPECYAASNTKGKLLSEMGKWNGSEWEWGVMDFESPAQGGASTTGQDVFLALLDSTVPVREIPDRIFWRFDEDHGYTAKGGYDMLIGSMETEDLDTDLLKALHISWSVDVPFKVRAFIWRCFLDRIATKEQLLRRGIPVPNSDYNCVFCLNATESINHLLFFCPFSGLVWRNVSQWVGWSPGFVSCVWNNFLLWGNSIRKFCSSRRKEGIIWTAVVWTLWKLRNEVIFKDGKCILDDCVWDVKFTAWKWLTSGKIVKSKCNFYEFSRNPMLYFK